MTGRTGMDRKLQKLTLPAGATILEALRVIDQGGMAIAFVRDAKGRIVGALTDGDLRRALLGGAALESRSLDAVMRRDFVSVTPDAGRAEVLDLMLARGIEQIPVIDARGRLAGVHSLHGLVGESERDNWAVILAGGRGTRLYPLTEQVPKPMLTVAGRPILERLVLHLMSHGIRRFFISVNYLAEVIEAHFGDGSRFGCQIEYLRESKPLGTGGPLALLPWVPKAPIIVMNGDLVTQFDAGRMLDGHERSGCVATMGLRPHNVEIPFGVARVQGHRLLELREKPTERMLINAGVYVLSRPAVRMVPWNREYPITELFRRCLEKRLKVGAHPLDHDWVDVGRHDELRRARGDV